MRYEINQQRIRGLDDRKLIPGDHEAAHRAAAWLRKHINASPQDTIFWEFEREFNCRLIGVHSTDVHWVPSWIMFHSEKDLTAFLLRWA
jgi:hypothetical protein